MPQRRFSIFGDASQGHHSSRHQRVSSLFRNFPEIRHALCKGRQSDSRRQPPVAKRYHAPKGGRCRASTPDRNRTDGTFFHRSVLAKMRQHQSEFPICHRITFSPLSKDVCKSVKADPTQKILIERSRRTFLSAQDQVCRPTRLGVHTRTST